MLIATDLSPLFGVELLRGPLIDRLLSLDGTGNDGTLADADDDDDDGDDDIVVSIGTMVSIDASLDSIGGSLLDGFARLRVTIGSR